MHPAILGEHLLHQHLRQSHDGGGEDNGHHAGVVKLERQILGTTLHHLAVAHHALGILHRDTALSLAHDNYEGHHEHHEEDKGHHTQRTQRVHFSTLHHTGLPCHGESAGKCVNNVHGNDKGNTITHATLRNLVTNPHEEHGAGHDDEDSREREDDTGVHHQVISVEANGRGIAERLRQEVALNYSNDDGQDTGVLGHLLAAAFLTQHLLPGGKHCAHELSHNGSRNVGHDTQSKDTALLQTTTGENRKNGSKSTQGTVAIIRGLGNAAGKFAHINAGQRQVNAKAHNHNHGQRKEDTAPELRHLHGISKC